MHEITRDFLFLTIHAILFGLGVSMISIGDPNPIAHTIWCIAVSLNGYYALATALRIGNR